MLPFTKQTPLIRTLQRENHRILSVESQVIVESQEGFVEYVKVIQEDGWTLQRLTKTIRATPMYADYFEQQKLVTVFVMSQVLNGDLILIHEELDKEHVAKVLNIPSSVIGPKVDTYARYGYKTAFELVQGPTFMPSYRLLQKRKEKLLDERPAKRMKIFPNEEHRESHYSGVEWDPLTRSWRAVVEWVEQDGPQVTYLGNHGRILGAALAVIKERGKLSLPMESIYKGHPTNQIRPSVTIVSVECQWQVRVQMHGNSNFFIADEYPSVELAQARARQVMIGLGLGNSNARVIEPSEKVAYQNRKREECLSPLPMIPFLARAKEAEDPTFQIKDTSVLKLYSGRKTMMQQAVEAIKRAEERFANTGTLLPKSGDVDYQRFRRWRKARWRHANVEVVKLLDARLPGWMGRVQSTVCVVEQCERVDMKPTAIPEFAEMIQLQPGTKSHVKPKTKKKPPKVRKRKMTQYSRKGKVGRGVIQRTRRRLSKSRPSYFYEVSRDYYDLVEGKRKKYGGMKGGRRMCSQSFRNLEDAIIHSDNCLRELVRDGRIASLRDIVHLLNRPTPEELGQMQPDKSLYMGVYKPRRGNFWCAEVKRTIGTELKSTGRIVGNSPLEAAVKLEQKLIDMKIGVSNEGIRDVLLNPNKHPTLYSRYKILIDKPVYKIKKNFYTDAKPTSGTMVVDEMVPLKIEETEFFLPPSTETLQILPDLPPRVKHEKLEETI